MAKPNVYAVAIAQAHRGLQDPTERCDLCDDRANWRIYIQRPRHAHFPAKLIRVCDGCTETLVKAIPVRRPA